MGYLKENAISIIRGQFHTVRGLCLVGATAAGFTGDPASLAHDNIFFNDLKEIIMKLITFLFITLCLRAFSPLPYGKMNMAFDHMKKGICPSMLQNSNLSMIYSAQKKKGSTWKCAFSEYCNKFSKS